MKFVAICLLVIALICVVSASVSLQPTSKKLLLQEYKTLRVERAQCKTSLKKAQGELDAEITIKKRDDHEIEIIKKLLASTEIMVHQKHGEKSRIVTLLKKLLARLLALRKKNKNRLVPFQRKVTVISDHCRTLNLQVTKARNALGEVRGAEKNQKYLDSKVKKCNAGLKKCTTKNKKLTSQLAATTKKFNNYSKNHNKHTAAHAKCRKAINTQKHNHGVASRRNNKLTNSHKDISGKHSDCTSTLKKSNHDHNTCKTNLRTCQAVVSGVQRGILGQEQTNKLCNLEYNHCEVSMAKHKENCEKTADKAENLEELYSKCDKDLKTCTPKMERVTQSLKNCQDGKKLAGSKLSLISKKHADVRAEISKYRPLTEVPDKPVVRPVPVIERADTVPAPSRKLLTCTSSGDPHYRNYENAYFDVYGWFGIFTLSKYKHVLNVQTNIRKGSRWGNRGLNSDVVVGAHSNIVEMINYKLKINGALANIAIGKTQTIRDGCVVKRTSTYAYQVFTPEGAYVSFSQHNVGEPWAYSNLVVVLPENYARDSEGLCATVPRSQILNSARLQKCRASGTQNLFGKDYHVVPIVVKNAGAIFDGIKWASESLRQQATSYCASLKLPPQETVDCLTDAKISGKISGAKQYQGFGEMLKNDHQLTEAERNQPDGVALRELTRLKTIYSMEKDRLTILRSKLAQNAKNKALVAKVDGLLSRIDREKKFITHIQADFGKSLLVNN